MRKGYPEYIGGGVNPSCKAFTLAEGLITLAIIGVVASLTIPTLMKSYQKQQWITGYKSTFSIINQATHMIMADNNTALLGVFSDTQSMYNAYLPYLHVIKKCENQQPKGNCFASNYQSLNGNYSVHIDEHLYNYSVILSNGASLAFYSCLHGSEIWAFIMIDVNGPKGPNIEGKDYHEGVTIINIATNSPVQVKPSGYDYNNAVIITKCPDDLSVDGYTCGIRILRGDYGEDY